MSFDYHLNSSLRQSSIYMCTYMYIWCNEYDFHTAFILFIQSIPPTTIHQKHLQADDLDMAPEAEAKAVGWSQLTVVQLLTP